MTDKETKENIDQLVDKAAKKLHFKINWLRRISAEEIAYLLDRCPFLEIKNPDVPLPEQKLTLVLAESGWTIHDYGNYISSSPGELFIGGGDFKILLADEDEGESGTILNPGKGTIRKQAFDTAMQMVELADKHHWSAIEIVDGHPLMKRGAWIKAEQLDLRVDGFQPSKQDIHVKNRLELSPNEVESILKEMRLKR